MMRKMASAPQFLGSPARQYAAPPPPHSSLNSTIEPSLLNVAECQNEKLESATAATRFGFGVSLMSSKRPMPAHAPPARPTDGYTVMSWHCVSVRGANGEATPYFWAKAFTCERYDVESDLLDCGVRAPSDWTAVSKLTRAVSSVVTGGPLLPRPRPANPLPPAPRPHCGPALPRPRPPPPRP